MKKLLLTVLAPVLLSACSGGQTANNSAKNMANNSANNSAAAKNTANTAAPNGEKTAELKAYADTSMSADDRIKAIDAYVKGMEKNLPSNNPEGTAGTLKRKESNISNDSLKDATDEKWSKMHTYYDGEKLKRIKVYSPEGEKKTEEFYFYDDKAVFTFIENEGAGKKGDSLEAKGDKFYFGSEGLFAWIKENGSKADASSEEFKKYKEKLPKEISAFRNAGK